MNNKSISNSINASVVSGITEVIVTHPIDYIKTIKQSNIKKIY